MLLRILAVTRTASPQQPTTNWVQVPVPNRASLAQLSLLPASQAWEAVISSQERAIIWVTHCFARQQRLLGLTPGFLVAYRRIIVRLHNQIVASRSV